MHGMRIKGIGRDKDMKINSKQILTYSFLLGILFLVAFYFMYYTKKMDERDALIASNKTLSERVNSLKTYYDKQEEYQSNMEAMKPKIDNILGSYVPSTLEEDVIMQAVNTQKSAEVDYSNINIAAKKDLHVIPEDVVKGAGIEKYQTTIKFQERTATYANKLDYVNLKKVLQSFFESGYNIGVSNITYIKGDTAESLLQGFYDETTDTVYFAKEKLLQRKGILNGTLTLHFYSVSGNGKEYVYPDMTEYEMGATDFFDLVVEEEVVEQ